MIKHLILSLGKWYIFADININHKAMKSILKLSNVLIILLVLFGNNAYASFPNKQAIQDQANSSTTSIAADTQEVLTGVADSQTKAKSSALAGKKNMIISLLLWFFLGWIAGHRWYHGKPWGWNLLFIFTFMGFGIWWIVDLIFILTGKF